MNKIISFISCLLDMFILKTYLDGMLGSLSGKSKKIGFYASLAGTEVLLTMNLELFVSVSSSASALLSSAISICTTILLCFFYSTNYKKNILSSILFQIMIFVSEAVCILFTRYVNIQTAEIIDEKQYLYTMNLLSKIILLLIVVMISFILKRNKEEISYEYNFLIFLTPLFSIILLVFLPRDEASVDSNRLFYELFIIFIALLNIINNYFLKKLSNNHIEKIKHIELTKQVEYQKEKYAQLSESYRRSRRIIHDTKKHYFEIQENIKKGDQERLVSYLDSAISDLESTYVKYNTGNLVIDSLLTNYDVISKEHAIDFTASVHVDCRRIPLNDYDFCIILGNLLDNCLNACNRQKTGPRFIHISICTTNNDKFVIECQNSYDADSSANSKDDIEHGYGLTNIINTLDKYHGLLRTDEEEVYTASILLPITKPSQRLKSIR